jgi:hypothetical protein
MLDRSAYIHAVLGQQATVPEFALDGAMVGGGTVGSGTAESGTLSGGGK